VTPRIRAGLNPKRVDDVRLLRPAERASVHVTVVGTFFTDVEQ
jgi:hypothetical protein